MVSSVPHPLQYLAALLVKVHHFFQTSFSFIRWGCQNILPASKATNGGSNEVTAQIYPWEVRGSPRAHKSHDPGQVRMLICLCDPGKSRDWRSVSS